MNAILGANMSTLRGNCGKNPTTGSTYGKDKCRCVGIDNLKGYYATQENYHHVQRTSEAGASCAAWDKGMHPKCRGSVVPQWCQQSWCYVDPCSCDLGVLPKQSVAGVEYHGSAAYWSYNTCGGTDFFSQEMSPDACVNQKTEGACSGKPKCAWDGKQCGGKEVLKTCKEAAKLDKTVHGNDDCRCVGLGGKTNGKAFLYINDKKMVPYSPNVGSTCQAWEKNAHPDCMKKDGKKPSWCSEKWCFVDPCKCKSGNPMAVMPANSFMRFQGKTAYWSYATCGSADSWTTERKSMYCPTQKSKAACVSLDKCSWDGKRCLGKALVEICAKQESTGVLGVEAPLPSSAMNRFPLKTLFVVLGALAAVLLQ